MIRITRVLNVDVIKTEDPGQIAENMLLQKVRVNITDHLKTIILFPSIYLIYSHASMIN
jgi:hypothetical protein